MYNDSARTDLEGSIECFEIPDNVTDLHVLQHAKAPWLYYMRVLTGTLDNTCIYNTITETAYIIGPTSFCSSEVGNYIVASGSGSVDWNLPAGVTYSITGPNSIEITDWGGMGSVTITAEVTTACITTTLTFDVAVIDAITFTETISICENDTIIIFGDPVSDSGIFTETLIGVGGCDSIHTIIVNAIDTLVSTETISICINDTIFIDGTAVSNPGIFIQNLFAISGCDSIHTIIVQTLDTVFTNEIISSCDNDTIFIDGAAISDPGIFVQNLFSSSGCDSMHTIVVVIIDTIFSNEIITICDGETANIFGNYESAPGDYTQSIYTLNGCDSLHTITLIVEPAIDVYFISDTIISDVMGISLDPVILGTPVNISWNPDIWLTCNDCINPYLSFLGNGWYYINVTDANGCTDIDSIYVMLDYLNTIIAPNAFSPNGDGINDEFFVLGPECDLILLRIYNRWGALIFESTDINIGWDGTYKSIPQEIGAYVYLAEGTCRGQLQQLVGNITLIR